jgi:hypothetical protein
MVAIVMREPATARPHGLDFVAAILLFTAVYHLGYPDFRGEKLRKPLAGDAIWSVPTLATLSPIGSPIAHAGLHVSAVVHSYETHTFLPPHEAALDTAALQRTLDGLVAGPDAIAPGATAYVAGRQGAGPGRPASPTCGRASRCLPTRACGSRASRGRPRMGTRPLARVLAAHLGRVRRRATAPGRAGHELPLRLRVRPRAGREDRLARRCRCGRRDRREAEDEARFLAALMRGELLPPRLLRALKTPPSCSGYGLGLGRSPSACAGIAYTHSGGGPGYKTGVWVSEDGAQVAVLLLNGRGLHDADARADAAVNELFCAVSN